MERVLWERIQEVYYSAASLTHADRGEFVTEACAGDTALEQEINSLLLADDSAAGFLESPIHPIALQLFARSYTKTPTTDDDDLSGTIIAERYLVERQLSSGGIAKVYLANDLTLHHRRVVIKVLLKQSLENSYIVTKFKQEVEALARIDHPGVVSVLGTGSLADGLPYVVLQFIDGVTLRSQISGEGMDQERAATIIEQIGAALETVHEKRIFHRDLKPENIMLQVLKGDAELVKVVDFGIAKVKESLVAASTVNEAPIGTVLYMSPEQLRNEEQITAASDVYSMGVIAYEMLTGRRPFNPRSAPQLLEMYREGVRVKPSDLRPGISADVQAIILRALEFKAKDRYQGAAEFGESLALELRRKGTTEIQEVRRFPDKRSELKASVWLTKRRIGLVACSFALLALTAFFVYYKLGADQKSELPVSSPSRSFIYSLTVQRMRDNKPYQPPFQSTGQDVFDNGDQFRFNCSSSAPGYLYVFSEGQPKPDGSNFRLLFPTLAANNGSATVGADQWVRTDWNVFDGPQGIENFWFVWATAPIDALETAKTEAFKQPNGALTGKRLDDVKGVLLKIQAEAKTRISRDKNTQQTTVRGAGTALARMLQLQHR